VKWLLLTDCICPYMQPFLFKMNGRLDPYVPVSVPNGFHENGSSVDNFENLIDLSPPRCRVPSNPNHEDTLRDGQTPRVAYDSPSLRTNGVLYRNSGELASVSHLPVHYWSGTHCMNVFTPLCVIVIIIRG